MVNKCVHVSLLFVDNNIDTSLSLKVFCPKYVHAVDFLQNSTLLKDIFV